MKRRHLSSVALDQVGMPPAAAPRKQVQPVITGAGIVVKDGHVLVPPGGVRDVEGGGREALVTGPGEPEKWQPVPEGATVHVIPDGAQPDKELFDYVVSVSIAVVDGGLLGPDGKPTARIVAGGSVRFDFSTVESIVAGRNE